jgi:hypothetical protein
MATTTSAAAWDTASVARAAVAELSEQRTAYTCQAFHPTLPLLVLGTRAGYLTILELETASCRYAEKVHDGRVWDAAVSDDGALVVSAGDEGDVYLQEWAEMEAIDLSRIT